MECFSEEIKVLIISADDEKLAMQSVECILDRAKSLHKDLRHGVDCFI